MNTFHPRRTRRNPRLPAILTALAAMIALISVSGCSVFGVATKAELEQVDRTAGERRQQVARHVESLQGRLDGVSAGVDALEQSLAPRVAGLEDNLPVRLGFIYDQSPAPDDTVGPELPDTDRYWLTFGVGYQFFGIQADLAYQLLITSNDETGANAPIVGKRSASAHILSLGVGYKFDI